MKPIKTWLSAICVSMLATFSVFAWATQPNTMGNEQQEPSWHRVDRAAHNINSGDPAATRALVNEVLADDAIGENIIATSGSVPDRLVAAEIAFQKGKLPAITEERVVDAVNQLAAKFNAPDYACTDIKELRRLKLRMLILYPGLIGRGSAATRDDSKPHFEHTMSPLEAFHIVATLVFQKIANPAFQFSHAEREAAPHQDKATVSRLVQTVKSGQRTRELRERISQAATTMSLRDILGLSDQMLDRLNIPR